MAENGNRGPNDFRARTGRRRREPAIIDASATEVPLNPTEPAAADEAPPPAPVEPQAPEEEPLQSRQTAEPVLFGSAVREHAAASEAVETSGETVSVVDEQAPATPSVEAEPVGAADPGGPSANQPAHPPASPGAADMPPGAGSAARPGSGAAVWLLTLSTLALLGALVWTLYTEPQRSGRDEIADLRSKVAALEARPDPSPLQDSIASLDRRVGAADADRASLTKTVTGLTARLDALSQPAPGSRPAADASEPVAQSASPPSGTATPATAGALATLSDKVDAVESRVTALTAAEGQTAKIVADLPKPVTPDFGPVDAAVAALAGRMTPLDDKVNNSDAKLNAFDAKINGVDSKVNGLDARMNVFENRTNGLDAKVGGVDAKANGLDAKVAGLDSRVAGLDVKASDAAEGVAKLQATVANLPRVDLAPLQAAASGLDGRVARLEGQIAAPKDDVRVTEVRAVGSADETRAAPIALVGEAVGRAIADGRPYASDLDALKVLGAEPDAVAALAPLAAKGAPTVSALRDQWDGVRGDVLAALKPAESGSALDRFAAGARALVQVRRVGAVQGDDPAALVSQVDAALSAGDVPGALAAWDKLPPAGKDKSQDWAAGARGQVAAAGAAQAVVGRAITALGRTKS